MKHVDRRIKHFDWTRSFLLAWWVARIVLALYRSTGSDTSAVDSGDIPRQLIAISFAALGLMHWKTAMRRLNSSRGIWLPLLLAYTLWACCTLIWSEDASLSVRRILQFVIYAVGWVGLGAGYYGGIGGPIRFCRDFRTGGLILVALSLPLMLPELTLANIMNPLWAPEIRNQSSDVPGAAAFALMAYIEPAPDRRNYRIASMWGAGIITVYLILLKSRSILFLAVLMFIYLLAGTIRRKHLVTFLRLSIVAIIPLFMFGGWLGSIMGGPVGEFFARGNSEKGLSEMNGRLPLWNHIWLDVEQSYWGGVGFGAYWTTARMGEIFRAVGWPAPVAHNGFLDEMVQTGAVGLSLFLAMLTAMLVKLRKVAEFDHAASLAGPWIILFLLLNFFDSYMQNFFRTPFIGVMVIAFSCLSTAYRPGMRERLPMQMEPSDPVPEPIVVKAANWQSR